MPRSRALLVPPALFAALTGLAALSGWEFAYTRRGMYQYLPPEALESTWQALASLHSQPPGFNALLALGDRLGDWAPWAWWVGLTVATCTGLWLMADLIRVLSGSTRWAVATACVAAILPGTLAYSSWLSYTQVVAVLLLAAAWGVVVRSPLGAMVSLLAILGAFLVRASITWLVVVAWVAFVAYRSRHLPHRRSIAIVAIGCVTFVMGLSALRFVEFGTPTQSSWASQNYAKRLLYTFGYERMAPLVRGDACLEQLLAVGAFRPSTAYPACLTSEPQRSDLGPAQWADGSVNLNDEGTLLLSAAWSRFVSTVVRADPSLVVREVVPLRPGAPSALGQLMSPSADYPPLRTWHETATEWMRAWVVVTAPVPWLASAAWILGLVLIPSLRRRGTVDVAAYLGSSALLGYVLATYLFLELGENQRFRAEADFLLLALGAVGAALSVAFARGRRRPASARDGIAEQDALVGGADTAADRA